MKKIVTESLQEFMKVNEVKLDIGSSEAKEVKKGSDYKYKEAIKGLKEELAKAKKTGAFKTTIEKNAKIKELEAKIKKFEEKLKK